MYEYCGRHFLYIQEWPTGAKWLRLNLPRIPCLDVPGRKLGSMVRTEGLFQLLVNGVYWGYNLLLTFHPWNLKILGDRINGLWLTDPLEMVSILGWQKKTLIRGTSKWFFFTPQNQYMELKKEKFTTKFQAPAVRNWGVLVSEKPPQVNFGARLRS